MTNLKIPKSEIIVREAEEADRDESLRVETEAFGEPDEWELVGALLDDPSARPLLSLLALHDRRAVGHVLFTHARLEGADKPATISLLAPLAVVPEAQKRGVGGELIRAGLEMLAERGVDLVFVLGHPSYYPRYGFRPAGVRGFEAPYPIPEQDADAWMVQAIRADAAIPARGKVVCAEAMDRPEHWRE